MFADIVNAISIWAIPFMIIFIVTCGYIKKVKVYEAFTDGAKEGFTTAVTIIPFLVAMLVGIGIFRASGAMDFLIKLLSPVTNLLGIPPEILPMALMRPLSGGGAQGMMTEIFSTHGPDSYISRVAATMMGATETTFYVLTVYFGSIAVKNTRHSLPAGLLADLAGVITSIIVVRVILGP